MPESPDPPAVPVAVQPIELSYVSLAGDQVPPATRENAYLLQHAADYQTSVRNLRRSGIGDVIWGMLNAWIGFLLMQHVMVLGLGLLLLGSALIGIGLWIIIVPTPIGMVVDGAMLLLVAAWNLGIGAMVMLSPAGQPPIGSVILGLSQVYWGIHRIRRYPRFAAAVAMQPSAPTVRWLGDLTNATLKAKSRKDAEVIEFIRRGGFVYERWKGRLLPEVGVFVSVVGNFGGRRDVTLATTDEVEIVESKRMLLVRKYKVKLRLREKTIKATIPEPSLEKLQQWMTQGQAPTPVDVPGA